MWSKPKMFTLAIHGGAGVISRQDMSHEQFEEYQSALRASLQAGYEILKAGGSSLDACQAAVVVMEDSPLFNAGKGAVFTNQGRVEMDASVMEGKEGKAGAVAGLHTIRNPVLAARLVMDRSPHVMLVGDGAENFARSQGAKVEDPSYFYTERRWRQLQTLIAEEEAEAAAAAASGNASAAPIARIALDHSVKVPASSSSDQASSSSDDSNINSAHNGGDFPVDHKSKFGTVGAVAVDIQGNVAAATSTGGMSNKRWGRVGDCPVIGAGTYANNATCAVSCTGHGEFFIRNVVAFRVSALMDYAGMDLHSAADKVVNHILKDIGGEGGLVAVDKHGAVTMPFNSEGMYRGYVRQDGEFRISIFGDDERM